MVKSAFFDIAYNASAAQNTKNLHGNFASN